MRSATMKRAAASQRMGYEAVRFRDTTRLNSNSLGLVR